MSVFTQNIFDAIGRTVSACSHKLYTMYEDIDEETEEAKLLYDVMTNLRQINLTLISLSKSYVDTPFGSDD